MDSSMSVGEKKNALETRIVSLSTFALFGP